MENPFTLTFGKPPYSYISRLNDINTIRENFLQEHPSDQVYIITGLKGSGKTVLLTQMAKEFMELDDWIVVDLNSEKDLLEGLASELYENSKIRSIFLKKEFSFSFKGISFSIEGETPVLTSETLIKKMLEKIKQKEKKVLIVIDDVCGNEYMRIFSKTIQTLIRYDNPIYVLMTGLYENVSKLQNDKSLTFLYRAPKIYLGALNNSSIVNEYVKALDINEDEALEIANMTNGYAYAFQVLGYLLYKNNKKHIDDKIIIDYDLHLQEFVYDKLWDELSFGEKKVLKAIKGNDEIAVKDVLVKLEDKHSYFSVYRDKLIKKGIIYSPTYGHIKFTLPRFFEFIRTKK